MAKHAPIELKDKPVRAPIKPRRRRETQPPQTKRDQLIQMLSAKNGALAEANLPETWLAASHNTGRGVATAPGRI